MSHVSPSEYYLVPSAHIPAIVPDLSQGRPTLVNLQARAQAETGSSLRRLDPTDVNSAWAMLDQQPQDLILEVRDGLLASTLRAECFASKAGIPDYHIEERV